MRESQIITSIDFAKRDDILPSISAARFDLIIVDLDTPYLNLNVIIPKIKNIDKNLAIVVVNAGEEKVPPRTLKKMGVDLVIGRPLDMDRALSLISGVLATRSKS